MTKLKPPLKYFGSDDRITDQIIRTFPQHHTWLEACVGSGVTTLRKPRSGAEFINDKTGEIVNVYRVLRDRESAAELKRVVELTPYARDEFELSYERTDDPIEQARRTIFRSLSGRAGLVGFKTGFNSYIRDGKSAPHSRAWVNYAERIDAITRRLKGVVIENQDILTSGILAGLAGNHSLIYIDPPYLKSVLSEGAASKPVYEEDDWGEDEHTKLSEMVKSLPGAFIVQGIRCDLYKTLYEDEGWQVTVISTYGVSGQDVEIALWHSPNNKPSQPTLFSGF